MARTIIIGKQTEAATSTKAGSVSIVTQTIAGAKTFSDQIFISNGSAAAPSIAFTSATTNGFYYSASGIEISITGSQRYTIGSSSIASSGGRGFVINRNTGAASGPTYSFNGDSNTGLYSDTADTVKMATNGVLRTTWDANGNFIIGTAALATSATNGFPYIPTCEGAPSGTPTSYTGRVPMIYDTTNNRIYIYNSSWKMISLI